MSQDNTHDVPRVHAEPTANQMGASDIKSVISEKPPYVYTRTKLSTSTAERQLRLGEAGGYTKVHRAPNNRATRKALAREKAEQVFLPKRKDQRPLDPPADKELTTSEVKGLLAAAHKEIVELEPQEVSIA